MANQIAILYYIVDGLTVHFFLEKRMIAFKRRTKIEIGRTVKILLFSTHLTANLDNLSDFIIIINSSVRKLRLRQ